MNSVNIMGRLCADVELKSTNSGKKVCNFRIAVDAGKDKEAYFLPVVAWNGTAENIAKYFHKGKKIALSGILTSRTYENNEGKKVTVVEILANSFDFCDEEKAGGSDQAQLDEQAQPDEAQQDETQPNNDLPFQI